MANDQPPAGLLPVNVMYFEYSAIATALWLTLTLYSHHGNLEATDVQQALDMAVHELQSLGDQEFAALIDRIGRDAEARWGEHVTRFRIASITNMLGGEVAPPGGAMPS